MLDAVIRAESLLPKTMHGEGEASVLDRAKALLSQIQHGAHLVPGSSEDPRPEQRVLQRAASVLAEGANAAADLARDAKDAAASELQSLAWKAWQVSAGPLLILALLYMLSQN